MKEQITIQKWISHVVNNCTDSYSLAACLATLMLWGEKPEKDEDIHKILCDNINWLSWFQAEIAISFYKKYELITPNK